MKLSVVLTHLDPNTPPFTMFNQMDDLGIQDVYIVLNDTEYNAVMADQLELFSDSPPQSILEVCMSHRRNSQLHFYVMNAGCVQEEESKFNVYFDNVSRQYDITILLSKCDVLKSEASSQNTAVKMPIRDFALKIKNPLLNTTLDSSYIKLSHRKKTLVLTLQRTFSDTHHYEWLFKTFVAIVLSRLSNKDLSTVERASELTQLRRTITNYFKNIKDIETAERNYDRTHFDVYVRQGSFWKKRLHARHVSTRSTLWENETKMIRNLCDISLSKGNCR